MKDKATVRIKKENYGGKVGQTYAVWVDGIKIFFPITISRIEEIGDCVDVHVDAWYAKKHNLETVAEWQE